jgi:hypothetical protein
MKRLFFLLILIILGSAAFWYARQNGMLSSDETAGISAEINTLQGNVSQQFSVLSSRAQQLGGHAQNVLGSSVQVDESEPSLQQKAIEYGQYLYCKQVVESYEAR